MSSPIVLSRRRLAPLVACATACVALPGSFAFAEAEWKPGRNVEIVVGTNPGTGFDRTARVLQEVWKEQHVIDAPVTVLNSRAAPVSSLTTTSTSVPASRTS